MPLLLPTPLLSTPLLIDTHTHFDVPEYDIGRDEYNYHAFVQGVRHVVMIGYLAKYFDRMKSVQEKSLTSTNPSPVYHNAYGLHPLYIGEHCDNDLVVLDEYLKNYPSVAIAEIGLDTYPKALKADKIYQKQQRFFVEQLNLAKTHDLPIMLHIRKAHADVLKLLKAQKYNAHEQGGIAHSFSGGENEALAFVKAGFKLGITGQITNPNAKKLRNSVMAVFRTYGAAAFVIETDCPDMMPVPCQHQGQFNEPKNLVFVLETLSELFNMDKMTLAQTLWQNSNDALRQVFGSP